MRPETKEWLEIATSDYDASVYLFEGARHPQAVYFICQAVEKVLKAAQVEIAHSVPRKIHKLVKIAKETGLSFSEDQYNQLKSLSRHYDRVRYPDYQRIRYNTKAKVEPIINQGKTLYLWILTRLKSH